ncbi:MAG: Uma2 family endonuclease [Cyanobacteria bacterium CRU_2_1]|nr:Uma2 family endonuclease [Cyanobacteria bacterium RU_5_0]NJR60072.1 Uma2 family endonuclease [Cyanobacteria bacterium CRU_2_1]
MAKKPIVTEQRIILQNIDWQKFETLVAELGVERQTRLTYFRKTLELMTPIADHERCHKLIESFILVLVDELALEVTPIASVLLKAPDLGCAIEPDACYYFRSDPALKTASEIHLPQHNPPDLAVEIAFTKSSLDKLPIYATLGISEVWRCNAIASKDVLQGNLQIYHLQGDRYIESRNSLQFPFLEGDRILQFLEQSDSISLATALRVLRAWVEETI